MLYVQVVPEYPHRLALDEKEDYFYWPARLMLDRGYKAEFLTTQPGAQDQVCKGTTTKRFSSARAIISYINKKRDIKLVHAHLRPYFPSLLTALSNKPKILTPHTYILGSNPFIAAASVFLMKKFDRIIALTPYEKEVYVRAGIPAEKIAVIPHPVNYRFYSAAVRNAPSIRKKMGIKDELVIVTVANIRKFKRIDTLLKAFKELSSSVNAKLIIVGEDLLRKEKVPSVTEMAGTMGIKNLVQTGFLPAGKVSEILAVADVFVNTSDNEPMCLAVYEAASAGVPLCLSNIGSFTSVFKGMARYHHCADYLTLAENILYYARNRREAAEKGRKLKQFVRAWDFDAIRKRMAKLYEEVMGES